MMKGKKLLVLLVLAASSASVIAAELDVELGADIFDKYVWRGQQVGNQGVIQPSATIGTKGYSFNVWGNMPMTKNDASGQAWNFQELDYTLDYSGTYEGFNYSAGYIYYTYPRTSDTTAQEIYGAVGMDTFLSPTLSIYKGTYGVSGFYINLAAEHSLELTETLSLDLASSLGWGDNQYNKSYFSGAPAGLNDLVLSAALPVDVGGVTLVPSLSYVTLVNNKVRQGHTPKSDNWIIGIGTTFEF
ncbi:hypothetical protein ACFL6U_07260 [Planctomycetota bacterium]